MPSLPHWIEPAVEYLRQKAVLSGACHESRSSKLLLALQEALTNAVVHGNLEVSSELKERDDDSFARALAAKAADPEYAERNVEVVVDYDGRRCCWIITDEGRGFDVNRVLGRLDSDDPELSLASGRGILIMRSFLDELRYEADGRRAILTLKRESGEEKRRRPRVGTHQPVRVAPIRPDGSVDWEAAQQAVSLNLSEHGIGLLQEQLTGTERVLIGIFTGEQPIYLPAEVRHVRQLAGHVVELGCRFQTQAEVAEATQECLPSHATNLQAVQEAVAALLAKRQGSLAGDDDRRAHPRVVFNERIEIVQERNAQPLVAYARDLSRGGISFIATEALPQEVVIVLLPRDGTSPLRVRARVVRCNRIQEGFFDVGAKFQSLDA
ncbi:MAG: hypothetical protein FJ271_13515 [Planctomycetes bacterium]|nr:hypothetical protein [Planctomycetota bacterium]